jgi:hypothetical protein
MRAAYTSSVANRLAATAFARSSVLLSVVAELTAAQERDLERILATLLDVTTVDDRTARGTCRLCDTHACGHYEGTCPVTRAADRRRTGV